MKIIGFSLTYQAVEQGFLLLHKQYRERARMGVKLQRLFHLISLTFIVIWVFGLDHTNRARFELIKKNVKRDYNRHLLYC